MGYGQAPPQFLRRRTLGRFCYLLLWTLAQPQPFLAFICTCLRRRGPFLQSISTILLRPLDMAQLGHSSRCHIVGVVGIR